MLTRLLSLAQVALLGETFLLGLGVWVVALRLSTAARNAKWSSMLEADASTMLKLIIIIRCELMHVTDETSRHACLENKRWTKTRATERAPHTCCVCLWWRLRASVPLWASWWVQGRSDAVLVGGDTVRGCAGAVDSG